MPVPGQTVTWSVIFMTAADFGVSVLLSTGACHTAIGMLGIVLFGCISAGFLVLICLHHQNQAQIDFKVPFVPLLPAVSILINVLLMMHLAPITWLRLLFWLSIGVAIYVMYGMKHSVEEHRDISDGISKSTTYESMVSDQTVSASVQAP
uniref:AA_permease_C domain-containing protein n=1 Tax=Steinernema glaseri TaxID=37863 RepID=A0A1I7ZP04_9BILA